MRPAFKGSIKQQEGFVLGEKIKASSVSITWQDAVSAILILTVRKGAFCFPGRKVRRQHRSGLYREIQLTFQIME